ncbi:hypothetical protein RHSIM_Rhsim10G0199400 [Rhododendron simsii]|uniref:Uncharacterized protein n=1 Tax=Rhododendron simsii TaxID=118357 RepID=A0A834GDF0_RHOSS|nr:hypothetical protein RHSIM_Rhsim10G0199400 [Rhododendron simsii]
MYRFNEVKKPLYSAMGRSYELMEEIERAHLNCFPKVGEIRADGLMVKEKSFFYHLPDSLPIKHVFQGAKGTWFIHIEVCSRRVSDKSGLSESPSAEMKDQTSNSCNITDSLEHENIFSKLTKVDKEQMKAATDDNCLEARASAMPQFKPKTPPRSFPSMLPTDLSCKTSRNNIKRPDVGKHLVVAASKRFSCWVGAEKIETLSLEDFWTKSSINISFSWRLETLIRLGFWSGYQSYAVHYASTEVYRKSHEEWYHENLEFDLDVSVVKQKSKSFFCHLPDSLPIKHVFQEEKGTWFCSHGSVYLEVSGKLCLQECLAAQIKDQTSKILVSTLTTGR